MLRTLLEDRFRLRSHAESRKMPVYELAVDRKGLKLQRVKAGETKPIVRVAAGSIQLTKATSATFASQLSYALGQPVIDKTGLSGEFDFALEWSPETGEEGGPTTAGLPPEPRTSPLQLQMGRRFLQRFRSNWGFASNPGAASPK
jgi:uncharacterized protein (TIGR03435 family)